MSCDHAHVVARRLLDIAFGHIARHIADRDFAIDELIAVLADALDDEFTAITNDVTADFSSPTDGD